VAGPRDVDAYIRAAPEAAQPVLRELRRIILQAVPSAAEALKYGMPSYGLKGRPFVHFAAAKTHVGVYGLVHVDGDVPAALAPFLDHRSTLRFKLGQPLPSAALEAAVRHKAAEQGA
jgi:uncharacterized protein YdhG (YjbR/CyaY superfamily)